MERSYFKNFFSMRCLKLNLPLIWILFHFFNVNGAGVLSIHTIHLWIDLQCKIKWIISCHFHNIKREYRITELAQVTKFLWAQSLHLCKIQRVKCCCQCQIWKLKETICTNHLALQQMLKPLLIITTLINCHRGKKVQLKFSWK